MFSKISVCKIALLATTFFPVAAWSAHPLITDDTGTQGKGKFQVEVNGQYDTDKEDGIKQNGGQIATSLTYGIIDNIDIAVGIPYMFIDQKSDDGSIDSNDSGISDTTLDVKVRIFEKDGLSLAVKPGLSFPTGDDDKGLGAGKIGYHLFVIGAKEVGPWTFLTNIGYIRNETDSDEEKNIWHMSVAATFAVDKHWKIVGDAGVQRNTDKDGGDDPIYALAGVIYSPAENIDLDLGIKTGVTSSETDLSLMAGTTFRF
jgi:hypothetical protein